MTHIFKGIRSIFYDQKTIEKRGWDLSPREQRTYEYWALNLIAALIASGLCLSCIGVIWLFQTGQSHNQTVYGIVKTVTNISIGILEYGIITVPPPVTPTQRTFIIRSSYGQLIVKPGN